MKERKPVGKEGKLKEKAATEIERKGRSIDITTQFDVNGRKSSRRFQE